MEKRDKNIKRIAIIGPESTGKTTLAQQLAEHYRTVWVPEHSREYISSLDRDYTLDDIVIIAQQQLGTENELAGKANGFLFADTELILAKVWCEDVFDECPAWIKENLAKQDYHLYLLTSPDLPWLPDNVRENGSRREYFFDLYKQHLDEMKLNYVVIKGTGEERLENAIRAIGLSL